MLKRPSKIYLWILAAILLAAPLYLLGILRPIENAVTWALNPVMSELYVVGAGVRSGFHDYEDKGKLESRLKELEAKVNSLTAENARYRTLEEENKILRKHLEFLEDKQYGHVIGNVISRGEVTGASDLIETVVIDKGRVHGLYPGLVAVTEDGVVAGKLTDVKERSAEICLVNNENCRLAAAIMGEKKTSGIVQGELGLTIRMDFIPQTQIVEEDRLVITSGLEEQIPRGLAVGRVAKVTRESNELWQTATIEPLVNPEDLIIVSVLKPE
jgi:rod shape-determining protein MreC